MASGPANGGVPLSAAAEEARHAAADGRAEVAERSDRPPPEHQQEPHDRRHCRGDRHEDVGSEVQRDGQDPGWWQHPSFAPCETLILAQFPLAERVLEAIGVVVWPMVEFEADDALATAASRFGDEVEQVVICTPDKDLAQCVAGTRIVQKDRRRMITYDEEGVRAKFGVGPPSIPDWLGLVGDSADGFPGLPGWGEKSAATVLARWHHLERIPSDPSRWEVKVRGASRLAETLADRMADVLLFRRLATLRRDVPLTETFADLEWRGVPRAPWIALCEELGWERRKDRPHRWA